MAFKAPLGYLRREPKPQFDRLQLSLLATQAHTRRGPESVNVKKIEDLHILVVEDEAIIAMLIEDTLLDIGCKSVEVASSIEKALEALKAKKPDFAILDLNLHGSRSYPIADSLQRAGRPFVFLSGYGAKGLDGNYQDADVLQKPFQQIDLEKALQRALLLDANAS